MSERNENFIRVLGRGDVLALAFGAMIGFGWVVLTGTWLLDAGVLGAVIAFAVGGTLVVFVGLTYSELVSAMPRVGGEHHYAWRAIGAKAAFVASWGIALGYVSVVAFEAVALPTTLEYILPDFKVGFIWTFAEYDVYLSWVAIGVVGAVAITALNYFGIRPSAIFQIIAVLFLLGVGALLLFGIFYGGEAANFQPLFAGSFSVSVAGILAVVIATPFLFVGFDVIPQSAEEINLPYRQIGAILILSVVMAAAWYILIIVGVAAGMSQPELENTSLATADAMGNLFGSAFFSNVLILGGVAGILTSWNSFMVGGSRIFYAMAESGMLPAWLGRLHPRYKTPSNAILLIGGLSILAPFFGESALGWLVNAGGLGIVIAYFLVALSFLFLRRNEPGMERPFRAGRGPMVGIIAVVLSVGIGIQYLPYMPAGLGLPEWVIVGAWSIIGLVFLLRMNVPEYDAASRSRAE